MEKKIYFLTKNKGKLLAAKKVFDKYGIKIWIIEKEYPEIQASSSLEIARYVTQEASKQFNVPVLREDHSLYINALEYFPGPFTAFFDKNMPAEILLKMLNGFSSRDARMELAASLTIPNIGTFESVYCVELEINETIQGNKNNWDRILKLKWTNKTFSQNSEEENVDLWSKNYETLAQEFLKIYNNINE